MHCFSADLSGKLALAKSLSQKNRDLVMLLLVVAAVYLCCCCAILFSSCHVVWIFLVHVVSTIACECRLVQTLKEKPDEEEEERAGTSSSSSSERGD